MITTLIAPPITGLQSVERWGPPTKKLTAFVPPRQDIPFPPPEDKNQECLNTIANACGLLAVLALLGTISCIVPGPCLGSAVSEVGVKIMKTFFSTRSVF